MANSNNTSGIPKNQQISGTELDARKAYAKDLKYNAEILGASANITAATKLMEEQVTIIDATLKEESDTQTRMHGYDQLSAALARNLRADQLGDAGTKLLFEYKDEYVRAIGSDKAGLAEWNKTDNAGKARMIYAWLQNNHKNRINVEYQKLKDYKEALKKKRLAAEENYKAAEAIIKKNKAFLDSVEGFKKIENPYAGKNNWKWSDWKERR